MEIFGRYRLLKPIAVGGMAELFLARTASIDGFDKDLIIKRIRPELSNDELFVSMFIDEARVSMLLTHPHVVQVFDFGVANGSYYLAMEFVHGCDLGSLVALPEFTGVGLPPPVALELIAQACTGLDYAFNKLDRNGHRLNVIHRDVSPRNILVSFEGGVKVADFGIAKAKGRVTQTEPGMVLGKLVYMAPEHATAAEIDQRADIFSTGAVLWELLTSKQIYGGDLTPEAVDRIRYAAIDPPSTVNRKLPRKLDKLVMRAVARSPDERYQTARELGLAIREYLQDNHPKFTIYDLQSFLQERRAQLPKIDFEGVDDVKAAGAFDPRSARSAVLASAKNAAQPSAQLTAQPSPDVVGDDEQTPSPDLPGQPLRMPPPPPPRLKPSPTYEFSWSPEFIDAVEAFRSHPDAWRLVAMADLCRDQGQREAALVIYRIAAITFARHGLLAQALLCCRRCVDVGLSPETLETLVLMPSAVGMSDQAVAPYLFVSDGPVEELMRELLSLAPPRMGGAGTATPLLSQLDGDGFSALAQQATLKRFDEGQTILQQGSHGRTMFLLASGRALVHATKDNGERVYLASLTAGDFFGENGFFTGAPRSATVEALYPVEVFELDRELYDRVTKNRSGANATLLRFYKDRVVDVVLAKSPIFGLLPNGDRRSLLDKFALRTFNPDEVVLREGELSDQIYLIKDGEAVVETNKGGGTTVLSTIGPNTLFGEVAAMRHIPRTATVRARTKLETMTLAGTAFTALLDAKPDLKKKVVEVIAARVRENLDKLMSRGV